MYDPDWQENAASLASFRRAGGIENIVIEQNGAELSPGTTFNTNSIHPSPGSAAGYGPPPHQLGEMPPLGFQNEVI